MAALTADRNTKSKFVWDYRSLRVAAGVTIYQGAMVCPNQQGYAVPAADSAACASQDVLGVACETVDNSAGGDGDVRVKVQAGIFAMNNFGDVTQARTGQWAYVSDDQTVAATSSNWVYAGMVLDWQDQDDHLVYIRIP